MESKKFILQEKDIPTAWYNVLADMPVKPRPLLNPATKQPLKAEDLFPVFTEEAARQELNETDTWIEIPEEVREMYRIWRPTLSCAPAVLKSSRHQSPYIFQE